MAFPFSFVHDEFKSPQMNANGRKLNTAALHWLQGEVVSIRVYSRALADYGFICADTRLRPQTG